MQTLRILRVSSKVSSYHILGSVNTPAKFIKLPRILETSKGFFFEKNGKVLLSTNKFEETLLRKEFARLNPV